MLSLCIGISTGVVLLFQYSSALLMFHYSMVFRLFHQSSDCSTSIPLFHHCFCVPPVFCQSSMWSNSLGKVAFYSLRRIQTLKIIYMLYLGNIFENLTKRIQSFPRFKNFWHFLVFILSYRANSKRLKQCKILKISFLEKIIDLGAFVTNQN